LFVSACLRQTLGLKRDKSPVADRNAADSTNSSLTSTGGHNIPIIFGACTHSKRRPMARGPITRNRTARNTRSMFGATPLSSKNTVDAAASRGQNR
jgi:hypothetical protein